MELREKRVRVLTRVAFLWFIAMGVPKLFFVLQSQAGQEQTHRTVASLIDAVPAQRTDCYGSTKNVALITNRAHLWGKSSVELERLLTRGMTVKIILVPYAAHKVTVVKQAPQLSCLSATIPCKVGDVATLFSADHLMGCEALCLDIQDTGLGSDGYAALVYAALSAAKASHKELIILDYPNPLGGVVEGWYVSHHIPLRHGMTLGELAQYMNTQLLQGQTSLTVIPFASYNRLTVDARMIEGPFTHDIMSLAACRCASFLSVLETIEPFDVAKETRYAYQALLLPEQRKLSRAAWEEYRKLLKKQGIESRLWRYYSKRTKRWLSGLRLGISEGASFSATEVILTTLSFFKNRGIVLKVGVKFDKKLGDSSLKAYIQGKCSYDSACTKVRKVPRHFLKEAFVSCLYKPLPHEVAYKK